MKTHYSCAELAALRLPGYPTSERAWRDLVEREGWECREVKSRGRGGLRREYLLPERVAKQLAAHQKIQVTGAAARQTQALLAQVRSEVVAEKAAKTQAALDSILSTLTEKGREKFEASYDILIAFRAWYAERKAEEPRLSRKQAFDLFAEAYNAGHVKGLSAEARAKYTHISSRTIQRWVLGNEKNGIAPIADRRAMKGKGPKSIIEQIPSLEKVFVAILTEKPNIHDTHLHELLNNARVDRETGEELWPVVSYCAVNRYRKKFQEENEQALLALSNPDAWKGKYLSSLGKLDGDVHRLNQRWEMDGTPADWEFIGGRYTASVVLDVWSRRPKIRFSKTPRTETNKQLLREAVLEWGVPDEVMTYMQRKHSTLGMSPFERIASSTTPVRRIVNERALDILLAKPAGNRLLPRRQPGRAGGNLPVSPAPRPHQPRPGCRPAARSPQRPYGPDEAGGVMGSVKSFKSAHGYTLHGKPDEPDARCFHCRHVEVPRVLKPYHRCLKGDFITQPFTRCDLFQRKEA